MQGRADITVATPGYAGVNHAEQHDTLYFSLTIRFQERKPAFFLVSQCKEIKSDFQVTDEGKISLQLSLKPSFSMQGNSVFRATDEGKFTNASLVIHSSLSQLMSQLPRKSSSLYLSSSNAFKATPFPFRRPD